MAIIAQLQWDQKKKQECFSGFAQIFVSETTMVEDVQSDTIGLV